MRATDKLPGCRALAAILAVFASIRHTHAATSVPSSNLDLSQLGRVAIAGDFESISLYTYEGQSENSFTSNGSQSLLMQTPGGSFQSLAMADAFITTMCPFVQMDGSVAGVVVGGNFTSLGGVQAQGIALWNQNTSAITPLPGLSGRVNSVYCDATSATVYVGGSFTGGNSTNAIAWVTGWTNLPFAGFNGPVTSITKAPNGNIVFGGLFDGLGNASTPAEQNSQVINVGSANVTATSTTNTSGFDDPRNIICKTGSEDGSGNTWLLDDDTVGSWEADFGFGFNPTLLRLYNTNQGGRGTKTFRFVALPINGIMNLTYVDSNGQNASCSADCPLSQGSTDAQDFSFVNVIGMNSFRIEISDWYGSGGGLAGIELFQDDIYSFAISDFNEPQCDGVSTTGANSTATGPWIQTPSGQSTSDYLTASLTNGTVSSNSASVIFQPNIQQPGNYSITLYTPGCIQDDTCATRGTVNITGTMTSQGSPVETTVYQTNDYDKYDEIYYGYVGDTGSSFRPTVTLTPSSGQSVPLTVVAQRVRFELITSDGGLNGLYEYNPNEAVVSTNFSSSVIDSAGMSLDTGAVVNSLAVYQQSLIVAGNLSTSGGINEIFSINTMNATALPDSGLNAPVQTLYQNGSMLYAGGNFTSSGDSSIKGLGGVAGYSLTSNAWQALGAGVNGSVSSIVPLQLNITSKDVETCLAISGSFTTVNGFGSNSSFTTAGFAVWVPSRGNWLHNLANSAVSLSGQLFTQTQVPGYGQLLAGSLSSQPQGLSNAVGLSGSGQPSLEPLGLDFNTTSSTGSSSAMRKRANTGQNVTGVSTGLFYSANNMNITVLGGNFAATASDGSEIYNLLIINDTASQVITGLSNTLDTASTFLAMDNQGPMLYAGGSVTGTVNGNNINGLVVYDLATGTIASSQPPALAGTTVSVNAIAAQPSASAVFVGGTFSNAGSLNCPSVCMYDTTSKQWMSPGTGLGGSVSAMTWASNTELIIAGNLTTGSNSTMMVTYDSKSQTYTDFAGASALPGPINALTPANSAYNQFWVAGTTTANGSAYLEKYNGTSWTSVPGLGAGSTIRGLQILSLTQNHDSNNLVAANQVLLITGAINIPSFGNASAVLFNGTDFQPFLLTNSADSGQGSVSRMFVQNPGNFLSSSGELILCFLRLLFASAWQAYFS